MVSSNSFSSIVPSLYKKYIMSLTASASPRHGEENRSDDDNTPPELGSYTHAQMKTINLSQESTIPSTQISKLQSRVATKTKFHTQPWVCAVIPEGWGFLKVWSGNFTVREDVVVNSTYLDLILLHSVKHGNRYTIMQSELHKFD